MPCWFHYHLSDFPLFYIKPIFQLSHFQPFHRSTYSDSIILPLPLLSLLLYFSTSFSLVIFHYTKQPYISFLDSFSSEASDVSSVKATTMYAMSTALAATAAEPPLTMELSNRYWHVKKVVNGRNTMAAVKSMSFLTTELKLVLEQDLSANRLYSSLHTLECRPYWKDKWSRGKLVIACMQSVEVWWTSKQIMKKMLIKGAKKKTTENQY